MRINPNLPTRIVSFTKGGKVLYYQIEQLKTYRVLFWKETHWEKVTKIDFDGVRCVNKVIHLNSLQEVNDFISDNSTPVIKEIVKEL